MKYFRKSAGAVNFFQPHGCEGKKRGERHRARTYYITFNVKYKNKTPQSTIVDSSPKFGEPFSMTKSFIIKIFFLLSIFLLNSCKIFRPIILYGSYSYTKVKSVDGSDTLKAGLRHGCETGNWTRGNSLYIAALGFRQDPKLVTDDEYMMGWFRGYLYCFQGANSESFMVVGDKAFASTNPIMASFDPQGQKADMGLGSSAYGVKWDMQGSPSMSGFGGSGRSDINGATDPDVSSGFGIAKKCHFC